MLHFVRKTLIHHHLQKCIIDKQCAYMILKLGLKITINRRGTTKSKIYYIDYFPISIGRALVIPSTYYFLSIANPLIHVSYSLVTSGNFEYFVMIGP